MLQVTNLSHMNNGIYPPSPVNVPADKLSPSTAFRKQVGVTIFSIILFLIVYLILVAASIALAIGCFYGGVWIIIAMPKFITLMLGLGAILLGVSVIFFLIKFIFAVNKDVNPGRVEIKEADQPQLFAFIRKLTQETKTPFPKRIYVSPDVNACVFYNSSFWSMFFPVRKNLEIGLGLVNSVNLSEFKAVMAHELGHFSQRSMKLGSFTYNVNRIIYNMLYENNSYTNFLHSWGRMNSYLAFFANITVRIAQGIQTILKEMYKVINKSYFGLSREMEFHADAVAASVAGGNNLVTALSKLDVAQSCYSGALENANDLLKENKVSKNIFDNQLTLLRRFANDYQLPTKDGLPHISFDFIESFSKSRVNYKNQWASHPELKERKEHLEKLDIQCAPDELPAWAVFANAEGIQEEMTQRIYHSVKFENEPAYIENHEFEKLQMEQREKYSLPAAYKGYYDKRFVDVDKWDFATTKASNKSFDDLFNDSTIQLYQRIRNNEGDLQTLKAIREKQIDVKSFDFDGQKYQRSECEEVIKALESEITAQKEELDLLDKEAFFYFCEKAGNNSQKLIDSFKNYQELSRLTKDFTAWSEPTLEIVGRFYRGGLTLDQVIDDVSTIKSTYEPRLKEELKTMLQSGLISASSNEKLYNSIRAFISGNNAYFTSNKFQNEELNELVQVIIKVNEELHELKFKKYKEALEIQLN